MKAGDKIAIIGAGASGLTAAVSQARKGRDVTVYEHKEKAGLKLAVTGNGKCNFTNSDMSPEKYYKTEGTRFADFLSRYTYTDAIGFMSSIGIDAAEKSGYYYPSDFKAVSVVNALLKECERLNVRFDLGKEAPDIDYLRHNYDAVIIACGSRAHKETGSNGSGYKLLERLGIKYSRILPALCAINIEQSEFLEKNKGKRLIAAVEYNGYRQTGEIQINDSSISGIPVLNISRYVSRDVDRHIVSPIIIDLAPDYNDIPEIIRRRVTDASMQGYVASGTKQTLKVGRISSFDKSQVCTGGVSLYDLSDDFEVKDRSGIYIIGEMCDVDGMCGGYNLHWAWLSGNLCAE